MPGPTRDPSTTPAEAVIVAGGFGTRMLPLTERRPKHLLEVGGVPFLEHQITKLADAGVEHVVLATSYRADLFEPVLGHGERFGVRLDLRHRGRAARDRGRDPQRRRTRSTTTPTTPS